MSTFMNNEAGEYAVRAGPGLAAGGLTLFGLPLSDIVLGLTAIYTILQIGWFVYSRYPTWKNWFKRHGS